LNGLVKKNEVVSKQVLNQQPLKVFQKC